MRYQHKDPKAGGHEPQPDRIMVVPTGSMHFDGEPWDDFDIILICLDCGKEVVEVRETAPNAVPDLQDFITI